MKKRLLFAVLFSAAAGGMLYQVSWSQKPTLPVVDDPAPVEAPGEEVIRFFPHVEAPGAEVAPIREGPQPGFCIKHPEDPFCAGYEFEPPPPVETPGEELIL